jgi:GH18 family chitinase
LLGGESKDYPNVAEWKVKDTGYHTGEMVKYKSNIFRAAYWAGKEPGVDPGWSLYDELYDETSHSPTQTAKIIGYIPTWRTDLDNNNAAMYQNITHGIIAFLQFDAKNLGELDVTTAEQVTKIVQPVVTNAHKYGTYISVALGGATDYGFLNLLTAVGGNSSDPRLDKAVQNVAKFVKDNALDGVDLDLECWWDPNGNAANDQGGRAKTKGAHPAGSALVLFAQKLKAALPGKLLSATLFATSWYGNNYDPKLADQVDWLSIMSYDLTGSWNQSPVGPHTALLKIRQQDQYTAEQQGPWPSTAQGTTANSTPMENNPIFSVEDSLWYWSNPFFVNWQGQGQKVVRDKLTAGVPLYGYDFAYKKDKDPQSGQTPPGYKVLRYKELVQQFPGASTAANANIKVSGNTPRPDFVSAAGSYPYAHNIYLEIPDTAVAKLNFLKKLGMQGVILWEMSNEVWDDGKSIVKALYKASGNPSTRPPLPAPSFAQAAGNPIAKQPAPSGDLTGKAGQQENVAKYGTHGTPGIAVYKGVLYAVHEGYEAQLGSPSSGTHIATGRIWYTGLKNDKWESPKDTNTNNGTTGAPALMVYGDEFYAFHEGFGENGQLWFMKGKINDKGDLEWGKDENTGFGTTGAPALAVFNGKLYCVHLAKGGKPNQLWWACYNGTKWEKSDTLLGNQRAASTPSLAVYNKKLYCAYQGANNGEFWYVIYQKEKDGNYNWTPGNKTAYATYGAPSLTAYKDKLQAFHEGYQGTDVVGSTLAGAAAGALAPVGGPEVGAAAGAIAGAAGAGRTYKLWYTGCETGKDDFTAPNDTDTGFGVTDPPSLAVAGNKLYCVHQGHNSNGEIWWFTVDGDKRSEDGKLNGATASPPALAEFNGELYCVYQKAGPEGYMGWTKLPLTAPIASPNPTPSPTWVEVKGANSYRYYKLNRTTAGGVAVTETKTLTIDSGAPFLYAAITQSTKSADLPSGATLKITGPDGKTYNTAQNDDQVYALAAGNSLTTLVIKNPKAGDYKVELTVPKDTIFNFGLATLPSRDIGQTILDAFANVSSGGGSPGAGVALQTSGGDRKGKRPFVGRYDLVAELAAAGIRAFEEGRAKRRPRPVVEVVVSAATGGALTTADLSEASTSTDPTTDPSSSTPAALDAASGVLGAAVPTTGELVVTPPNEIRVGTWNVFSGTLTGRTPAVVQSPIGRMQTMIRLGARQGVAIMGFQEVPQGLFADLRNRIGGIWDRIRQVNERYGTNYDLRLLEREYPEGITNTASSTTDGYVIVYDQNVVTRLSDPTFFQPDNFREGTSQARPPVQMRFRVPGFGADFSFFTWHVEAAKALAKGHVATFYRLVTDRRVNFGHWILAGDLNVKFSGLQGAIQEAQAVAPSSARIPNLGDTQELHHYDDSLDYVVSDQTVGNFIPDDGTPERTRFWGLLFSDAHYALFAYITFGGG